MALTPLDIENTRFRGAFNGYNRAEVDQLIVRIAAELEAKLRKIDDLQQRIGQLEQAIANYRESEELLKNSVVLAQRTSDEIIASAHQQADVIKRDAESESREISRRLAELQSEREQFEYAFHGLLSGFLNRLEQGNPALEPRQPQTRELPAESGSGQREPHNMADSHSSRVLSEAGSDMTPDSFVTDTPAVPSVEVPQVPDIPGPRQPGAVQPGAAADEFEEAIQAATAAPGSPGQGSGPQDTQVAATAAAADTDGLEPELTGIEPMESGETHTAAESGPDGDDEEIPAPDDRLPLD